MRLPLTQSKRAAARARLAACAAAGALLLSGAAVAPAVANCQAATKTALDPSPTDGFFTAMVPGIPEVPSAQSNSGDTPYEFVGYADWPLCDPSSTSGFCLNPNSASGSDPYVGAADFTTAWQWAGGADTDAPVAIIDTGFTRSNSDAGYDFPVRVTRQLNAVTGGTTNQDVAEPAGGFEGDAVASIVAARTDDPDKANMTGAAQNNAVMLYRVSGNSSQDATQFDVGAVAKSVRDAADNGAKVILIETADPSGNQTLKDAIQYANASGAVIVAPAGTADQPGKDTIGYPAAFSGVISVGALAEDGSVPDYSRFANAPKIVAPGYDIVAMTPNMNDDYSVVFGTAYAAAYVAAAAALVIRSHPGLRPMDVEEVLEGTARQLSVQGNEAFYGSGALDAGAAVKAVTCGSLPGGAVINSGTWLTTPVANLNLTAGTPVRFRLGSGGASSVTVAAGSLPPGVALSRDASGWIVSGTPTYFGDVPAKTFTATLLAQGSGQQQVTITMTVGHAAAVRVVPDTGLTSKRVEARAGVAATVRAFDQYGNSWSLTGDQNASIKYPSSLPNCTFKAGKGHAKRTCVVKAYYRVSDAQTLAGKVTLTVYDRTRMKVKITGTVKARARLRAKATPKGWPVTYRWYKGSHAIKHATKSSYKLPKKVKKGTKYRVKITLRFGDGTRNTKASKYVKAAKTTVKH
jgi:hypothetical protein